MYKTLIPELTQAFKDSLLRAVGYASLLVYLLSICIVCIYFRMYECMLSVCMSVNVYTSISLHVFMYMKYILVICFSLYIRLFIVYNAFNPPRILGSIVKVNVRRPLVLA